MSEDQNAEYQVQGARPRRTVRQPTYLQDFEVQYAGLPRANVLLPQSTPQPHGPDDVQQYNDYRDPLMAHPQASSIHHDQREEAVGSPDSLESSHLALEPWYLTTDHWSEREEPNLRRAARSSPPDVQSAVHDLEQENRRLRAAQLSMREKITRLMEIQKSMQEMLINQSQSQKSVPIAEPQVLLPPIPLPRVASRQSESPVPTPAPRAFPVPAPRRLSTPRDLDPYAATVSYAQHGPPSEHPYANAFASDNVAGQISSSIVDTRRVTQDTRQPTTTRRTSVITTPPPFCYSQPHTTPANFPGTQANTARQEILYRGPQPTIPDFSRRDPSEFARLKLALTNLLPDEATELFKYQVLVDHLKLADARLIADSFLNSSTPYSDTLAALTERFGRPDQLALSKIATIMDASDVQSGDTVGFERFVLQIQALVGFLKTLGDEGDELHCGSHVARLLSKLPPEQRASFRRHMSYEPAVYTLLDLAKWLKFESWCQDPESFGGYKPQKDRARSQVDQQKETKARTRHTTILHGSNEPSSSIPPALTKSPGKSFAFCPYCDSKEHYLSQCPTFQSLTKPQVIDWIKTNNRCWKCGRTHRAAQCTLKKLCHLCNGKRLQILHEINIKPVNEGTCLVSSTSKRLYLDRPQGFSSVLLKMVRVTLKHKGLSLDTYAVLDDGSERTMLLPLAARKLGLTGQTENLTLRTIRQDITKLHSATVSFQISTPSQPGRSYNITGAFTAEQLSLTEHTYPVAELQRRYRHLRGLPLQPVHKACPLLLGMHDIIGLISESADNDFKCKYRHRPDMKHYADMFCR
ncbi:hypothetical protein H4Q32_005566 [Labeo rohita]|uniref:CCHC-type domain-containing protein n=1 Tax=Labeo rohita TaxID=84645 RepID=A0ABQ8N2Q1_LABRO|nr:hypothetical protein H4Q32_005566 [Labeo rohita]